MSEIWLLTWTAEGAGPVAPPDLTGFDVEATDGHIGKVDESSFDADAQGALVVDTGFWIFGKKRMLPGGLLERVDTETETVYLTVDKDTVKDAPDLDEARKAERAHRDEIGDYFATRRYAGMRGDPIGPQPGPGRTD